MIRDFLTVGPRLWLHALLILGASWLGGRVGTVSRSALVGLAGSTGPGADRRPIDPRRPI
jgi:hypothetical protein